MSGELAVGWPGGGNPGKSEVSAKEVVRLGETKQTTRRAGKRNRSDRAAPLGRGKRTPMGVVRESGRSSRRSNSTVSRELEGDYIRPRDSGNGSWGEVGLRGTATVRETQTVGAQVQQQGKGDVRCRDQGTDSEENHRTSGVPGTEILRPSVSQAEEGWLHEAGLQPEIVEQVPEVSTLQNGKHGNGHQLDPEEGLVHQDRPQRCVLDGTSMSGRQEVPSICMERASVAVSSPGVWTSFGTPVFHQTDETGGGVIKEDWHEVDVIFGRCSGDESTQEMGLRDRDSVLFLLQKLGFIINWKKSELQPEQIMEFLGFSVNSMDMTLSLPRNKILDIRSRCQDMIRCSSVSVRQLAKLIGKLTATALAIILGLYCRQLQMLKTKALLKGQQNYEAILTLTAECRTAAIGNWIQQFLLSSNHNGGP